MDLGNFVFAACSSTSAKQTAMLLVTSPHRRKLAIWIAILLFAVFWCRCGDARAWRNEQGDIIAEGTFLALDGAHVIFRNEFGDKEKIKRKDLCTSDRYIIARLAEVAESLREIEVEGSGSNTEEALRDASRAAVRQRSGALLAAVTEVENDQLVRDSVLTVSEGYLYSYDIVSPWNATTRKIRIRAQVSERELPRIPGGAFFDPSAKAARDSSIQDRRQLAIGALQHVLDSFDERLLKLEVTPNAKTPATQRIEATVTVSFDTREFDQLRRALDKILRQTSLQQGTVVANVVRMNDRNRTGPEPNWARAVDSMAQRYFGDCGPITGSPRFVDLADSAGMRTRVKGTELLHDFKPEQHKDGNSLTLLVIADDSVTGEQGRRWHWYLIDWHTTLRELDLDVEVSHYSKGGKPLRHGRIRLGPCPLGTMTYRHALNIPCIVIGPFFCASASMIYADELVVARKVQLPTSIAATAVDVMSLDSSAASVVRRKKSTTK